MMNPVAGVAIRAVASAVPTRVARTAGYTYLTPDERSRFQKATGIAERRIVHAGQCASDLCMVAAQTALERLGWARDSIGALVLITQTGDQPVPATSIGIQHKLGLAQTCLAFDVNLGCSSYPYGLAIMTSLMRTLGITRSLLLIGDVSSLTCAENDKSAWPLFGDAGSATALELDDGAAPMYFDLMSDGEGKEAIIIRSGGLASRHPPGNGPVELEADRDGVERRPDNLILRGADIFGFAISKVPPSIQRVLAAAGKPSDQIDFLVLHQANKMINDTIAKKTGFGADKLPTSIERFGNTSSASIPVTLCSNAERFADRETAVVTCGFGVGLSWGSAVLTLPAGVVIPCVESDHVYA
ncbi:ketoacyl-ACP synthase III [Leptospira sp. 96542]|nr:ketoacyl-ACP synthase III [Leptospira sp. 96542]